VLTTSLPPAELVGKLITGLVGRQTSVDRVPAAALDLTQPGTVSAYVQDNGMMAAVIVSDLALSASGGAALALIPPGAARDAAGSGSMPGSLAENYREIVNVAARLFNRPNTPHVRLREMHVMPEMLPADVSNVISDATERLFIEVQIEGYPLGKMWLFA
jgi:hypothetical protein